MSLHKTNEGSIVRLCGSVVCWVSLHGFQKKKTISFYLPLVFKLYNAIVTQYFVRRNRLNLNADAE